MASRREGEPCSALRRAQRSGPPRHRVAQVIQIQHEVVGGPLVRYHDAGERSRRQTNGLGMIRSGSDRGALCAHTGRANQMQH